MPHALVGVSGGPEGLTEVTPAGQPNRRTLCCDHSIIGVSPRCRRGCTSVFRCLGTEIKRTRPTRFWVSRPRHRTLERTYPRNPGAEALDELKNSKAFKESAKEGLKGPFKTVGKLVTAPVKTVSNVASGVGHWFQDVGRAATSDDPDQPGVAKTALGQAAAKRQFAYDSGVNPYSRFEPLQDRLNEVAWVAVSGGITVNIGFGQVSGSAGTALNVTSFSAGMKQLVRDNSPGKLHKINADKLKRMGVTDSVASELLDNPVFDPQETTLLVGALDQIHGATDRELFVAGASQATDRTTASFMRQNAEMLRQYNLSKGKVTKIVSASGVPFAWTQDGKAVGFFALDHLAWTWRLYDKQTAAATALDALPGLRSRELWIGGTIDPKARKALENNGWVVNSDADRG